MKLETQKQKNKNILCFMLYALCFMLIILPVIASAYTLLQKLPESGDPVGKTTVTGLSDYLSWLYRFALGAAIFLAVLKIVIGGILIIVGGASEGAQSKGRDMIEMALWGLLLALCAWLLLNAINPAFIEGKFGLEPVTIQRAALKGDWLYDPGIAVQRVDGSFSLNGLLFCMRDKLPVGVGRISSISDSSYVGNVIACDKKPCPVNPPCAHKCQSCHYGGGTNTNKSYAVDFGDEQNSVLIKKAASECGARFILNEGNHVHVSTKDCPKN